MKKSELLEAVVATIQQIEMKATESNMDKLLGCIQTLRKVAEELKEGETDA